MFTNLHRSGGWRGRAGAASGDAIDDRVHALEAVCARLEQENTNLRASVEALGSRSSSPAGARVQARPVAPAAVDSDAVSGSADGGGGFAGPLSRRGLLRAAGVAAAGVATVAGLEHADTAQAANGSNVVAGAATTAEARTSVLYDGTSGFNGVVLLGNDSAYDGSSATYPAALGGFAGAGSTAGHGGVANGVYGYTDNGGGYGVVGINSGATAGGGSGVFGAVALATQIAVNGSNPAGTAIQGSSGSTAASATAINGVLTSTTPGGFSSAVRGDNRGTGGLGIGVWGSQAGSGWGGYFTSQAGVGVLADGGTGTGVSANGATGVTASGGTAGTGVSANGATGVTASGGTAGVSASSSTGRGVVAAGGAAQIQLTPGTAATHPTSGAAGDIYVDSKIRPWFCQGGKSWIPLIAGGPQGPAGAQGPAGSQGPTGAQGQGTTTTTTTIRLVPSSSRRPPRTGKVGELFVDREHRLWFCKVGGRRAHWKQIA